MDPISSAALSHTTVFPLKIDTDLKPFNSLCKSLIAISNNTQHTEINDFIEFARINNDSITPYFSKERSALRKDDKISDAAKSAHSLLYQMDVAEQDTPIEYQPLVSQLETIKKDLYSTVPGLILPAHDEPHTGGNSSADKKISERVRSELERCQEKVNAEASRVNEKVQREIERSQHKITSELKRFRKKI